MVKRLRNKFVIITTSLMVVVLGSLLLINTLYNNYWHDIEIIDMLEWIAGSGIFYMSPSEIKEQMAEELDEGDKPIVGIVLDSHFTILEKYLLGDGRDIQVSEELLFKMCEKRNETNKIGRYFFAYSEPDESHILLVIMDSSTKEKLPLKILGGLGLTALGILLLVLITLFLSRFVTEPAEQSLMREKRFISDASHELKTPLGAISINAQALKLSNEDNMYLNNIISESERMDKLIEKLLTLSKFDEEPEMKLEKINLSEIAEEMALTYESVAFEKKVSLEYKIEQSIHIQGNQDEIRQLMVILLDNAIKNTPELGAMKLNIFKDKKSIIIEIVNTGKGIRPEDIPHVFERFYTTDQARKSNSFGLGLAIAKAIVERHKGTIAVESVPDKNTKFTVCLK